MLKLCYILIQQTRNSYPFVPETNRNPALAPASLFFSLYDLLFFCQMRHYRFLILMLMATALATFSRAQQPIVTGWLASFNTIKLNNAFSLHFDGQLRSTDQVKQLQTILLRPGLNYHVNKQFVATLGYAYIGNRRTIDTFAGIAPEHRVWQQLLISHPVDFVSVSHRFRLEQRFLSRSVRGINSN